MAMERTERPERPMNRDRRPRRKVCAFCADKIEMIDYKDTQRLRRYLSERGKIVPRRYLRPPPASADHRDQACPSSGPAALCHRLRLPAVKSTRTPCPCGGVFLRSAPLMGTCLTFTPPYV